MQCFDFYSLLLAVGRTHVNYFSLDVEGPELDILETIPFDRVTIDIFTIEYRVWAKGVRKKQSLAKLRKLRTFFKNTGLYEEVGIIPQWNEDCCGLDVVFKRVGIQLINWGRVTHICVGKLTIIGSDNGLSPGRCQGIIWINAGILLIKTLGTNFSEHFIGIHAFSFKKMHLKNALVCETASILSQPQCVNWLAPGRCISIFNCLWFSNVLSELYLEQLLWHCLKLNSKGPLWCSQYWFS